MKKICIAKQEEKINQNVSSCYLVGGNSVDWLFFLMYFAFFHIFHADYALFYNRAINLSIKNVKKKLPHAEIDLSLCFSINISYHET